MTPFEMVVWGKGWLKEGRWELIRQRQIKNRDFISKCLSDLNPS